MTLFVGVALFGAAVAAGAPQGTTGASTEASGSCGAAPVQEPLSAAPSLLMTGSRLGKIQAGVFELPEPTAGLRAPPRPNAYALVDIASLQTHKAVGLLQSTVACPASDACLCNQVPGWPCYAPWTDVCACWNAMTTAVCASIGGNFCNSSTSTTQAASSTSGTTQATTTAPPTTTIPKPTTTMAPTSSTAPPTSAAPTTTLAATTTASPTTTSVVATTAAPTTSTAPGSCTPASEACSACGWAYPGYRCDINGTCWGYSSQASCEGAKGLWCTPPTGCAANCALCKDGCTCQTCNAGYMVVGGLCVLRPAEESAVWLKVHNIFRCMHGAQKVTWNAAAYTSAQNYVNNLTSMVHSACYSEPPPAGPAGENLASGYGSIESAAAGWYKEVNCCASFPGCSSAANTTTCSGKATGHFTAMIWNGVNEIACANNSLKIYICRYRSGDKLSCNTANMGGCYTQNVFQKNTSLQVCIARVEAAL